jgi:hypothetical protein
MLRAAIATMSTEISVTTTIMQAVAPGGVVSFSHSTASMATAA